MKNLKKLILFGGLSLMLLLNFVPALASADTKSQIQCGVNQAAGADCNANPDAAGDINKLIKTVVNLLSIAVGIIAVIMIIIAGLRYVSSAGKEEAIKGAKNTILYAIIGLVIVALAQIIVHFVLKQTTTATNGNTTTSSKTPKCANGQPVC